MGDAFHHKDPIDGQGIYDALLETKLLDEELAPVLSTMANNVDANVDVDVAIDAALARHRDRVLAATTPMFHATVRRVRQELFQDPPWLIARTLIRWLMTDDEYQRRFVQFLLREEPASTWPPSSLVRGAALRGMARDVRSLVGARAAR